MEKIKINTSVEKDLEKVWDYYTNPEHIINWNFASDDWCCPSAENNMQVGGKYKARMEAKDGSFGFDFEAVYKTIDLMNSFNYEMEDGRNVNVVFKAQDKHTDIEVTFDPESQNPIDMQQQGWQAILNNFKKYAEQ